MKIVTKEMDGIPILTVSGEMYGGPENYRLKEMIAELAEQKKLNLVIDMAKVKWLSSTGIGILVASNVAYQKAGGRIRICNVNQRILSLLGITKLNVLFEVHDSVNSAISAIQASTA
jgi:anti-sigma B factor antagonist